MRACGILPSWHYHPIDVPSLAEGWLRGRGRPLPDQLKSDELCRAIGVDPDKYARHTALGDCELFRAVYETLILPLDVSSERVALAAELERPGSPLCDCTDRGQAEGRDGQPIPHHCDCPAVIAAATVLRSIAATDHGRACVERDGRWDQQYAPTT
jgi:DNA polymerase III epsilon subunit-like protein